MRKLVLIIALGSLPFAGQAEEKFHPGSFHRQNCTGCHDTSIYTRTNRRVNSLSRLESQVRMCDANLGIKLFDDELKALVDYLDENYYKFGK